MARVGEELKKARLDANMSLKQLAKKLGVSESFINEVEQGRRVVNEAFLERFNKVFKKEAGPLGLGSLEASVQDEAPEKARPQVKKETYAAPATPVNELWNQAFGENIKNVPVYGYPMTGPLSHRSHVVEGKKIDGHPMDKVFQLKVDNDDMKGFRIRTGDVLSAVEVKEISGSAILLVEYKGKNLLRKVRNLNNGNVELTWYPDSQKSEVAPLKEVKPLGKIYKVEITL